MNSTTELEPSVARDQSATLFVALELSKATWLVALHAPDRDRISQHRLSGGDQEGLLALIGKTRARAEAELGRPVRVVSCYEAGYDGFWLHRLLRERGIENHVLDPASLLVDRRARRAKTDRLDAAGLLRTLMARARGERQVCRVVRVPSPEEEDARRQHRERTRLGIVTGRADGLGRRMVGSRHAGHLLRATPLPTRGHPARGLALRPLHAQLPLRRGTPGRARHRAVL